MAHGYLVIVPATIASADTISAEIDLGRAFSSVYLEIISMTSNSEINIEAAYASGGTYRKVRHPVVNSSAAQCHIFAIPSSVTNAMVAIPSGFRFMKIHQTATADSGQAYRLICSDN